MAIRIDYPPGLPISGGTMTGPESFQSLHPTPAAPTTALAGGGAGNVDNGTHVVVQTCITAGGETLASVISNSTNVVDKTTNGQITVTLVAGNQFCTGRNLYASKAGTTTPLFLIAASPLIADGSTTTTYTYNTADASLLATNPPTVSTATETTMVLSAANGTIQIADGTAAAPSLAFLHDTSAGINWNTGGFQANATGGNGVFRLFTSVIDLNANTQLQWASAQSGAGAQISSTVDTKLFRSSAGTLGTSIGTGTAVANIGGTYTKFVSAAGVGNGADLTQDALWTPTAIPANTLTANGDNLPFRLSFKTGATANNKNIGVSVGGTNYPGNAVFTGNAVFGEVIGSIRRVDATHISVSFGGVIGAAVISGGVLNAVVSDLTANTLAIVFTGASSTTGAAGDVLLIGGTLGAEK